MFLYIDNSKCRLKYLKIFSFYSRYHKYKNVFIYAYPDLLLWFLIELERHREKTAPRI